jgi:hypothetical protein
MRRVIAPQSPTAARAAAVREQVEQARNRGTRARTPEQVDAALDVILARLTDLDQG